MQMPAGLLRGLSQLDTCPVIVVRQWFLGVHKIAEESAVAAGFEFIDNFFYLNAFDLDMSGQGEVIELQAYRVDHLKDASDEDILALVFKDISVVSNSSPARP
jgi:hypothetical protein